MLRSQLRPRGQLSNAHDVRPRYFWLAPAEVTLQDVLEPSYWREVAPSCKARWALVDVVAENGEWECQLSMTSVAVTGDVTMRVVHAWESAEDLPSLPDGYLVNPSGGGWSVVHPRNGTIATGILTERAAREVARSAEQRDAIYRAAFSEGHPAAPATEAEKPFPIVPAPGALDDQLWSNSLRGEDREKSDKAPRTKLQRGQ